MAQATRCGTRRPVSRDPDVTFPRLPARNPRAAGQVREGQRLSEPGPRQCAADILCQAGRRCESGNACHRDRTGRDRRHALLASGRGPSSIGGTNSDRRVRHHCRRPRSTSTRRGRGTTLRRRTTSTFHRLRPAPAPVLAPGGPRATVCDQDGTYGRKRDLFGVVQNARSAAGRHHAVGEQHSSEQHSDLQRSARQLCGSDHCLSRIDPQYLGGHGVLGSPRLLPGADRRNRWFHAQLNRRSDRA